MNLLCLNFTLIQFILSYAHIGFSKTKNCNYLLKKYLLGFYFGVSIINLNYTIFFIKIFLNVLFNVILKNGRIMIFSDYKKIYFKKTKLFYKFFGIYFYFNSWVAGCLTHIKRLLKKLKSSYISILSLPDLILTLPYLYFHTIHNILKESNKLEIPIFSLIDSYYNPLFLTYFAVSNMQSFKTISFFFKLIEVALSKFYMSRKTYFLNKLLLKV